MFAPRIKEAPRHRRGFYEARPGDIIVRHDIVVIDIRYEKDLLSELGHIHGSFHHFADDVRQDGLPLPKTTPIALVCNNGRLAGDICEALVREHGFLEVYHLVGGMIRWTAEERPIAKTKTWKTFDV